MSLDAQKTKDKSSQREVYYLHIYSNLVNDCVAYYICGKGSKLLYIASSIIMLFVVNKCG